MSKTTTLQDLLGDCMTPPHGVKSMKNDRCLTIWVPADIKDRYDRLQEKSERRFSKKAREVLIEFIGVAEERIP